MDSSSSSSRLSQRNQSKKNPSSPSSQGNEAPIKQDLNTEHKTDSMEAVPELPQCKMGSKKVDDMRFMISCTNWY
ncbi:skin secretory protein xP2-like isoform X1 [Tachysurus ichikawai]